MVVVTVESIAGADEEGEGSHPASSATEKCKCQLVGQIRSQLVSV